MKKTKTLVLRDFVAQRPSKSRLKKIIDGYFFQGYARCRRHRAVRHGNVVPPQAEFILGFPEGRHGKGFPFVCRGMGMGQEGGKPLG